jgi:hypothetical protein
MTWFFAAAASAVLVGAVLVGTGAASVSEEASNAVPATPQSIQVPAGNRVFLVRHAVGTQNYVCLPSSSGDFTFVLVTPQATLFGGDDQQVATHYFSPNPFDGGRITATWQDSRDTATVWGQVLQSSSDPEFVAPGAIGWVLLRAVGALHGSSNSDGLPGTTYVQRLNTSGGVAPSTGCSTSADVGKQAFVPYRADYFFYESDWQSRTVRD